MIDEDFIIEYDNVQDANKVNLMKYRLSERLSTADPLMIRFVRRAK